MHAECKLAFATQDVGLPEHASRAQFSQNHSGEKLWACLLIAYDITTRVVQLPVQLCPGCIASHMGSSVHAGGGKSECYKILRDALNLLHQTDPETPANQSVTSFCLNPKSIGLGDLYGAYNSVSNDWKDGLASKLVREAMADESNSMKWLVFDGPVDAVWVENLNTVSNHAPGVGYACQEMQPGATAKRGSGST